MRSETRAFNEELRARLAALPATETVSPEVSRRARYEGRGIFPPPVFLPEARWRPRLGIWGRFFPMPGDGSLPP